MLLFETTCARAVAWVCDSRECDLEGAAIVCVVKLIWMRAVSKLWMMVCVFSEVPRQLPCRILFRERVVCDRAYEDNFSSGMAPTVEFQSGDFGDKGQLANMGQDRGRVQKQNLDDKDVPDCRGAARHVSIVEFFLFVGTGHHI